MLILGGGGGVEEGLRDILNWGQAVPDGYTAQPQLCWLCCRSIRG